MKKISWFDKKIDTLVLNSINSKNLTFEKILLSLPSVYPSLVLDSIRRLVSIKKVNKKLLTQSMRYVKGKDQIISNQNKSNIPHPLDFDWRFSDKTTSALLDTIHELTHRGDTIALLGVPSLYSSAVRLSDRKIIFLDKNIPTLQKKLTNITSYQCDLLKDTIHPVMAKVVVIDPPWYENHYHSFILAASKFCSLNGYLLIAIPQIGTRPNIKHTIKKILSLTKIAGFKYYDSKKEFLRYKSPLFEKNALKAEGINRLPQEWRRADLMVFKREKISNFKRILIKSQIWEKVNISGIEFRVRRNRSRNFLDPTLISIVDLDILPSVSSRDKRRKLAKVWTTGNRIYDCKGTNILYVILNALMEQKSPYFNVENFLNRPLTEKEHGKIKKTVDRISKIVKIECNELRMS